MKKVFWLFKNALTLCMKLTGWYDVFLLDSPRIIFTVLYCFCYFDYDSIFFSIYWYSFLALGLGLLLLLFGFIFIFLFVCLFIIINKVLCLVIIFCCLFISDQKFVISYFILKHDWFILFLTSNIVINKKVVKVI